MSTEFVLIELLKFAEPHVASNVRYIAFSMSPLRTNSIRSPTFATPKLATDKKREATLVWAVSLMKYSIVCVVIVGTCCFGVVLTCFSYWAS